MLVLRIRLRFLVVLRFLRALGPLVPLPAAVAPAIPVSSVALAALLALVAPAAALIASPLLVARSAVFAVLARFPSGRRAQAAAQPGKVRDHAVTSRTGSNKR